MNELEQNAGAQWHTEIKVQQVKTPVVDDDEIENENN